MLQKVIKFANYAEAVLVWKSMVFFSNYAKHYARTILQGLTANTHTSPGNWVQNIQMYRSTRMHTPRKWGDRSLHSGRETIRTDSEGRKRRKELLMKYSVGELFDGGMFSLWKPAAEDRRESIYESREGSPPACGLPSECNWRI